MFYQSGRGYFKWHGRIIGRAIGSAGSTRDNQELRQYSC